jgi:endonuclease/exonuclease/phosphatase family metal-dependent hydrolase
LTRPNHGLPGINDNPEATTFSRCVLSIAMLGTLTSTGSLWDDDPVTITVMTRNVFLGADVERVMIAETSEALLAAVEQSFQIILSTDWDNRVAALAAEIAEADPHLVGLQEISTLYLQSPGDIVQGGTTSATDVLWDYLQDLLDELTALDAGYTAVAMNENFDVEFPRANATFDDLRLVDYDVILARSDVETSAPHEALFQAGITVTTPLGDIRVSRGWSAVDAIVDGETFRFVNTHLESFVAEIRLLQASYLITQLQTELGPVILVGDLNTDAVTSAPAYARFIEQGYQDAWSLRPTAETGLTCCQNENLRNTASAYDKRVDLIMLRNFDETMTVDAAYRVGHEVSDMIASGVWPSDHGGVVAQITTGG